MRECTAAVDGGIPGISTSPGVLRHTSEIDARTGEGILENDVKIELSLRTARMPLSSFS